MTFFPEPLKPSEDNKETSLTVSPIEKDKKGKENSKNYPFTASVKKQSVMTAVLLSFLSKLFSFLGVLKKVPTKPLSADDPIQDLYIFYSLLEQLKQTDLSRDLPFCQHLSETWNRLLQHRALIPRIQRDSIFGSIALATLIKSINNFPLSEDQKLGYYLSKHVGGDWLPTPFMDLLCRLHNAHQVDKHQSDLQQWTQLILSILPDLTSSDSNS